MEGKLYTLESDTQCIRIIVEWEIKSTKDAELCDLDLKGFIYDDRVIKYYFLNYIFLRHV